MHIFPAIALLAAPALLSVQSTKYPPYPPCTLELRPSVELTVVDTSSNPQRDALVTFTLDGGPVQPAECVSPWYNLPGCDLWLMGVETLGTFFITATSADGTRTAQQEVTVVREDHCHVHTEAVTLVLPD